MQSVGVFSSFRGMRIAMCKSSPVVSLGHEDYVVRLARITAPIAEQQPDSFAVVAFSREGEEHVPISKSVATLDEAREALQRGFEPDAHDAHAEAIIHELLAAGVARQLA